MAKIGRPSKIDKVFYENEKQIQMMVEKGLSNTEIADFLKISESTYYRWKDSHPEFWEAIKDWKLKADKKIETSLYERAHGYSHEDTKAQWVENDVFDPESGEWKRTGRWEYADLTKHYPPDPTSMIFWLKNRQPDKWRDRIEQDVNLTGKITFKVIYDDGPTKSDEDKED